MSASMKKKAGIWLSNSEGLCNTFTCRKLIKPKGFRCQYFMNNTTESETEIYILKYMQC